MSSRTLSDEDVKAIAEQVKLLLIEEFQLETGKTMWTWAKRLVLAVLAWFAVLGMHIDRPVVEAIFKGAH